MFTSGRFVPSLSNTILYTLYGLMYTSRLFFLLLICFLHHPFLHFLKKMVKNSIVIVSCRNELEQKKHHHHLHNKKSLTSASTSNNAICLPLLLLSAAWFDKLFSRPFQSVKLTDFSSISSFPFPSTLLSSTKEKKQNEKETYSVAD